MSHPLFRGIDYSKSFGQGRKTTWYMTQYMETNPLGRNIGWKVFGEQTEDKSVADARVKQYRKDNPGVKARVIAREGHNYSSDD